MSLSIQYSPSQTYFNKNTSFTGTNPVKNYNKFLDCFRKNSDTFVMRKPTDLLSSARINLRKNYGKFSDYIQEHTYSSPFVMRRPTEYKLFTMVSSLATPGLGQLRKYDILKGELMFGATYFLYNDILPHAPRLLALAVIPYHLYSAWDALKN